VFSNYDKICVVVASGRSENIGRLAFPDID
jgi:hypothetical protein